MMSTGNISTGDEYKDGGTHPASHLPPSPLSLDARPTLVAPALTITARRQHTHLRRVKHRLIDANRRDREQSAVARLHAALHTTGAHWHKDKVSTLNAAAEHIANLTRTIAKLHHNIRELENQRQDSSSSGDITDDSDDDSVKRASMNSAVSVRRGHIDSALIDMAFRKSTVIQLGIDVSSGVCVMVNEASLLGWGWNVDECIGVRMCPPRDAFLHKYSAMYASRPLPPDRVQYEPLACAYDPQLTQIHRPRQYPRTVYAILSVIVGERITADLHLRLYHKDGRAMETQSRCWLSNKNEKSILHLVWSPHDVQYE